MLEKERNGVNDPIANLGDEDDVGDSNEDANDEAKDRDGVAVSYHENDDDDKITMMVTNK